MVHFDPKILHQSHFGHKNFCKNKGSFTFKFQLTQKSEKK